MIVATAQVSVTRSMVPRFQRFYYHAVYFVGRQHEFESVQKPRGMNEFVVSMGLNSKVYKLR